MRNTNVRNISYNLYKDTTFFEIYGKKNLKIKKAAHFRTAFVVINHSFIFSFLYFFLILIYERE